MQGTGNAICKKTNNMKFLPVSFKNKISKMKERNISIILAFIFSTLAAYSQVSVRGVVVDENNNPLTGVAVIIKSTSIGTSTDLDGKFSLSTNQPIPFTLTANLLGYKTQEIDVYESDGELIRIVLPDQSNLFDEVVVIGYGTQRRKELTGSVASVSQRALEQKSTSIDQLLGGTVSGVNVTQASGQPGAGSSIRIRGGNSVWASNEPLYVIDGFIYFSEKNSTEAGVGGIDGSLNPLASINPSDIESIEILKDVSAKAIYGSRGANGVIIVTTKKGKRGGNTVNYQYTFGVDKSAKKLGLLDAQQWAQINKTYFNNKVGMYYSDDQIAALGKGTDWQSAVLQTGTTQTHELSISGGDDKTRYLISGNYNKQEGIILNSGFERLSGRINLDKELYKNLTVGVTVSADQSTQNALTTFEGVNYNDSPYSNGIANSLTLALYMPPVLSIYNTDGSYNYRNPFEYGYLSYYDQSANPVSDLNNSIGQTKSTSVLGNFYAQYKIPYIDGLTAKINAGTNINYITQNFFAPSYTALGINQDVRGLGAIGNRRTGVTQTEYLLTYTKQINPQHYIDVLGGYTYQSTETNYVYAQSTHLNSFEDLAATNATGSQMTPPSSRTYLAHLHSWIGRVNYTLNSKYNLTATFRADNSSRFPTAHRWAMFPSIGLSWNVSDENFFRQFSSTINSLKLRTTYGTSGNQEISFNEYELEFNYGRYGDGNASQVTVLNNPNLKWETTTEYTAGIDVGILRDRVTFVADVYLKKTNDLLTKIPPPLGSATSELQMTNLGNLTNKGFEFSVNASLIERKNFTWTVSGNIARNLNTITYLDRYDNFTIGDNQEQILRVGESVGSFYGYIFDGVVQSDEDVSQLPTIGSATPQPGDIKLKDISGPDGVPDGKISPEYDRTVLGSVQPDFTYGFSSSFAFNRWDLYLSLQGSQGNKVYNLLRRYLEGRPSDAYNMSAALSHAWTIDNPSNAIPRIDYARPTELDSRFVEDASFLKLKNVTLGYNLPIKIDNFPVKIRLFASGRNLFILTKYKGYDPEVASGIDLGTYPSSRTFLIGAGITF